MSIVYRQPRFSAPEGTTEILLVRHGESAPADPENPFPLVNGQGDPPLHENGIIQAQKVADRLKTEPIKAIFVSNLQRTHQTAQPLCAVLKIEPIVIADLREIHLGEYEGGLYRKKVAERDPIMRRVLLERRWDAIPGAESNEHFESRLLSAIEEIAKEYRNQVVVAFVHGAVIAQIISSAVEAHAMAFLGVDNGSISHIVVSPTRTVVRRYNDTSHLSPGFATIASPLS